MARPSPWPDKILALLRAGNPSAAIAQIKVAPSVRDLNALKKAMAGAQLAGRWPDVDRTIEESVQALSAPRLRASSWRDAPGSTTVTGPMPRATSAATDNAPIGPAPKTMTESPWRTWARVMP